MCLKFFYSALNSPNDQPSPLMKSLGLGKLVQRHRILVEAITVDRCYCPVTHATEIRPNVSRSMLICTCYEIHEG